MDPPDTGAEVERWCRQLLGCAPGDAAAQAFAGLDEPRRRAVALALKARVDDRVRNRPPEAVALAEALLLAAAGLPDVEPLALRGRGSAAHATGDAERARACFEQAAEQHAALGDEVACARTLRSLVDVHQMAGRSQAALAVAERARGLLERHDEQRLLGQLGVNVGNVHVRLADYAEARRHYAEARQRFERLDDELGLAFCDFNLAVVAMNAHQLEEADAAWRRARTGLERAGAALFVADCDYHLAFLESRRGRFGPALVGLERARDAYRELGKPAGPPLCDLDLAEIHLTLGALRDGRDHARRAATCFADLGMDTELGRAEVVLGMALGRLGRLDEAEQELARAERRLGALGNTTLAAFAGLQRARLALEGAAPADLPASVAAQAAALRARGATWLADLADLIHGRALLAHGEAHAALTSLAGTDPAQDGLLAAPRSHLRARALTALGRGGEALDQLRLATDAIDRAGADVPGGDIRMAYFGDRHEAFADLTRLLLDEGRPRQALAVLERSRSRSLLEGGAVARDPGWRETRERLDWLLARQLDVELGRLGNAGELRHEDGLQARLAREIDTAERALTRLSHHARGSAGPGLEAARELGTALSEDEQALVFLEGRDGLVALLVQRDGGDVAVEPHALELSLRDLRRARDTLRFQLARRRQSAAAGRQLDALLTRLGDALLGPVLPSLRPGRPLVLVPSGLLHDLPFAALAPGGRALLLDHDLSQAVSLAQLAALRARPQGAPESGVCWCAGASLELLPAIDDELAQLTALFGARARVVSPDQLVERLRAGDIRGTLLHVAGHGRFQSRRPRFSAICLGERFLLAHDIASMTLQLDLVTLSGCETGRRHATAGEEWIGLPRALLGAGARAVVGSLWSVDDTATARFMQLLYAELSRGLGARAALSAAGRVQREETGDPTGWAAFSLVGDPDVRLSRAAQSSPSATASPSRPLP